MQKAELIAIRPVDPDGGDTGFILETWLKGLRYSNSWFECIDQRAYFSTYLEIIKRILARPSVTTHIACLRDDPDVILGYSVTEPEILHWVFVKAAWRRIGIGSDLIPKDTKTITHLTKLGLQLKPDFVSFNPFL